MKTLATVAIVGLLLIVMLTRFDATTWLNTANWQEKSFIHILFFRAVILAVMGGLALVVAKKKIEEGSE